MNLYLLKNRLMGNESGFTEALIAAESEEAAREIHPNYPRTVVHKDKWGYFCVDKSFEETEDNWIKYKKRSKLKVKFIGIADPSIKKGVVMSDYFSM